MFTMTLFIAYPTVYYYRMVAHSNPTLSFHVMIIHTKFKKDKFKESQVTGRLLTVIVIISHSNTEKLSKVVIAILDNIVC